MEFISTEMYDRRLERFKEYLSNVDFDVEINDYILHAVCVNWQGSGKDLLLNADILNTYVYGKSLFHDVFVNLLNRSKYRRDIKAVYSNVVLNRDVYADDYYKIDSISDIKDARDGVIYISDAEKYFNSRGVSMEKADATMIDLINNCRKDGNYMRFSCHRFMSIHVRIRELIPIWILPDIIPVVGKDIVFLKNYLVKYKLVSSYGKLLLSDVLYDLPKYAFLYDTLEKSVPLKRSDL